MSNRSARVILMTVLGGVFPPVSYALAAVLGGVLQLSAQPPSYYAQPESFR